MSKNKFTFLLIAIVVLVVVAVVIYVAMAEDEPTSPTSGLAQSVTRDINGTPTKNPTEASAAESLLQTLKNLQHIELNDALFMRNDFRSLVDHTVTLTELPRGRHNPFAPLNASETFGTGLTATSSTPQSPRSPL